jgi:hypothetical protein
MHPVLGAQNMMNESVSSGRRRGQQDTGSTFEIDMMLCIGAALSLLAENSSTQSLTTKLEEPSEGSSYHFITR